MYFNTEFQLGTRVWELSFSQMRVLEVESRASSLFAWSESINSCSFLNLL